jgi:hypothetical protein
MVYRLHELSSMVPLRGILIYEADPAAGKSPYPCLQHQQRRPRPLPGRQAERSLLECFHRCRAGSTGPATSGSPEKGKTGGKMGIKLRD